MKIFDECDACETRHHDCAPCPPSRDELLEKVESLTAENISLVQINTQLLERLKHIAEFASVSFTMTFQEQNQPPQE